MERTYLDYFNFYLKQCINEIISYFPYTKTKILENYRNLLENKDDKSDMYVKYFMTKVNDHLPMICSKNEQLFENKILYFIEGVNFHEIWHSSDATDNNKQAIWKFLQLLSLLGSKCLPNKTEILTMLEKVGGVIDEPEKMRETLEKPIVKDPEEEQSEPFGIQNLLQGLGGLSSLGNNGDMSGLGDGFGNIINMAKTLSESLQNVDMTQLQSQMTDAFKDIDVNNTESTETSESSESSETSESSGTGKTTEDGQSDTGPPSSLFSELAEEMSNTFNFDELEKKTEESGKPPDIGEALNTFMTGDNPKKFMNLISKFGNKLQNDIKSGKVNHQDLLKQSTEMMNGMSTGDLEKQAEQMFGKDSKEMKRLKEKNRAKSTRERLQKKLADKKKDAEK